jgi:hypothetical protein
VTVVAMSVEVRREALRRRATDLLINEPFGPLQRPLIDELHREWGIDLDGNPDHVVGMALLQDAIRAGDSPSPRAWQLLGCAS